MNPYKRIIKILWIVSLSFVVLVGVLMWVVSKGFLGEMPDIYEIKNPKSNLASEVYSEDSVLLGKFYHQYDRIQTAYNEISPFVIQALISTEDERFYSHAGIDFRSLLRAVFYLGQDGGGSTITQQLAKNLFTQQAERGFTRVFQKLKEWVIALKLEKNFSKQEILTLYLNAVPFGDNVYGIRNAAMTFFQKQPYELKIEEAAVLIGLLKSNTAYNPRLNPNKAVERRNVVIHQMFKNTYISQGKRDTLMAAPLTLHYLKLNEKEGMATYFREYIRLQAQRWINAYQKRTGKRFNLYADGLKIYTTINSRMQLRLEQSVQDHISKMQMIFDGQIASIEKDYWKSLDSIVTVWKTQTERYTSMQEGEYSKEEIDRAFNRRIQMSVFSWRVRDFIDTVMSPLDSVKYHKKMLQAGALVVNPIDGKVKAWVGGINYKVFKYDHVVSAKRQVGSVIKPLLYALALEQHGFRPETICSNTPQCFATEKDKEWCTKNNPGSRTDSTTSLLEGIVFSLNNVSGFIIRYVTPQKFAEFLKTKLQIQSDIYAYPSLSLGTSEFTLYEMVRAYTIFPSNGVLSELQTITTIADAEGRTIEHFRSAQKSIVLSEATAYSMSQIMQGSVNYGTARRIRNQFDIRGEMAGKTGTTNDFSDAWFIGFSKNLLGGVWVGCEDKIISFRSREGEGSSMALPIFGKFWVSGLRDKMAMFHPTSFTKPLSADNEVKTKVSLLSKKGLEEYLNQNPGYRLGGDAALFNFVLNDPYRHKQWDRDSLLADSLAVGDSLNGQSADVQDAHLTDKEIEALIQQEEKKNKKQHRKKAP